MAAFSISAPHVKAGVNQAVRQQAAPALASLLSPLALIALLFGVWRLGADLGWTEEFAIPNGLFSHWQVWMVLAVALQMLATNLTRVEEKRAPRQ